MVKKKSYNLSAFYTRGVDWRHCSSSIIYVNGFSSEKDAINYALEHQYQYGFCQWYKINGKKTKLNDEGKPIE